MLARIGLTLVLLAAVAVPATAQAKTRSCGSAKLAGKTYRTLTCTSGASGGYTLTARR